MNRQQLFEMGLKYVQQLSSRIWTDYNVHDPGITTLELLCYALTDLSYRASFPIEDLLASENANSKNMKEQFFTARQILPSRALTELDYRKLLIDLPEVKNAWLEQATQVYYAVPVKGELLGTPTLFADEIINLPSLVARLKAETDSVSRYLLAQLRDVTREALAGYEGVESEAEPLQTLLVEDINQIIQGDCFYQNEWLGEFTISSETQSLIARYQQAKVKNHSTEYICDRLNRLLLEDIYPESIARYHLFIKKIIDLPSFIAKLKQESPDLVSRYLLARLRDETREELAAYENADSPVQKLHTLLVEDLNQIIQGESIYEEERFSEFTLYLSPETIGLIALQQQLNGNNLSNISLNQLLLNDVYPQEIGRYHPLRTTAALRSIKKVNLAGLYHVIIDYMDDTDDKGKVMQDVKQLLQENRNLCEDFVSFRGVATQSFLLCAELELAPDADASRIQAEIFFQVQQYLAPPVNNYSLSEMLERTKADGTPYTVDEIFEGPLLHCGFIDDDELRQADLRTEIRLSDLISIIMDIAGVQAVRDIVINPAPTDPDRPPQPLDNKWVVSVTPGKKALLAQERSRLVFYKRNMPITAKKVKVNEHYKNLIERERAKAETPVAYDLAIPLGNFRQLKSYYSFQNHFPAVYGIGETGLSSAADDKRKALAYQLKAYLLFFDQIMANYLAQLSHVKELFSKDANLKGTYLYQVVDSFADYNQIYDGVNVLEKLQHQNNEQESSNLLDRRNRFLDHLIARFAERFHDFAAMMYSEFGFSAASIVSYKCEFLQHYPTISSERSLAYNYSLENDGDLWDTDKVSGLQKRLAKLLGIRNHQRRNLSEIDYDYTEIAESSDGQYLFRIQKRDRDTSKIILSSSTNYPNDNDAKDAMERAIHFALLPAGYDRKVTRNNKHYFNIIDDTGDVVARRIEYFDTEAKMNQAIDEVIEYLQVNYSKEGMYLIENILLRPEKNGDPFLPICPDPNCLDGADADPYSYRIHIILPAYSSRFNDMDFRRFAEALIREETPAHILPKICWINEDNMAELERLYRDWIYLKAGVEKEDRRNKLENFIYKLYEVKSVYPQPKLRECDSEEGQDKFILGRTILGSNGTVET